jgi:hypothetical protein
MAYFPVKDVFVVSKKDQILDRYFQAIFNISAF